MKNIIITIYGHEYCQDTLNAIKLCESKNIPHNVKDIDNPEHRKLIKNTLGLATFYIPVIFVGSDYLGNYQSLKNHLNN